MSKKKRKGSEKAHPFDKIWKRPRPRGAKASTPEKAERLVKLSRPKKFAEQLRLSGAKPSV